MPSGVSTGGGSGGSIATPVAANLGGTGVANDVAATITISGTNPVSFTINSTTLGTLLNYCVGGDIITFSGSVDRYMALRGNIPFLEIIGTSESGTFGGNAQILFMADANNKIRGGITYRYDGSNNSALILGGAHNGANLDTLILDDNEQAIFKAAIKAAGLGTGTGTSLVLNGSNNIVALTSSKRFKKNIEPLVFDKDKFFLNSGQKYDRIDENTPEKSAGFIAEEFIENGFEELVIFNSEGDPYSFKYLEMTAYLFEALKETRQELKEIKSQLNTILGNNNNE